MRFTKTFCLLGAIALSTAASPAFAGPPHTVSVGGVTNGVSFAHVSTSTTALSIAVDGPSGVVNLGCSSATAVGFVKSGLVSGTWLRVMKSSGSALTGIGCLGPGGLTMQTEVTNTWSFLTTGLSTTPTTDVIDGAFSGFRLRLHASPPSLCDVTISGFATALFDEGVQQLEIEETGFTGNLEVTAFTGCFGLVGLADDVDVTGTFNLEAQDAVGAPAGAINVY